MTATEVWLLAGIVAFYVYDATVLLYADEMIAWPGRGGWSADVGGQMQWRGGFVFVPALWQPGAPLLRLHWLPVTTTQTSSLARPLARLARTLRPLQVAVWLLAALLFLAVPAVLLAWPRGEAIVALVAAIYLLCLGMVVYTVRTRQALGLSREAVLALAIDTLACPPFALNLVRKIGLRQTFAADGLAVARQLLPDTRLQQLHPRLIARLDVLLVAEPEDNERTFRLQQIRARLVEEVAGAGD